jgi:hypothetical protein
LKRNGLKTLMLGTYRWPVKTSLLGQMQMAAKGRKDC